MQNPTWVNGGFGDVKTIATTTFQDAGKPILTGKCCDAAAGVVLRGAVAEGHQGRSGRRRRSRSTCRRSARSVQTPVEGGGEFVTAFSDRPEVQAVQTYLSTPHWAEQPGQGRPRLGLRQQRRRPEPVHRPDRQAVGAST